MIFSDIEDTTYVALYTVIKDIPTKRGIYKNLYTMIPLLIDVDDIETAREYAKSKTSRKVILEEIVEINIKDKDKILNFYI